MQVIGRTDDGSPVPANLQLSGFYQTGHSSTGTSLNRPREATAEFKTTWKLPACKFLIGATAPGFAPMATEPATVFLADKDRRVEVVLTRGFNLTIQILDINGKPVAGARVKSSGRLGLDNGWSTMGGTEFKSDQDGIVHVDKVSGMDHEVEVRAHGFEHAQQTVRFSAGQTMDWRLKPAAPTRIQFVDAETRKAVPGVKAVIFSKSVDSPSHRGSHSYGDPRSKKFAATDWRVFGESNADGTLTLDELQDGTRYLFAMIVDGYGTKYVPDVRPGGQAMVVELDRPINLSGQLTGALD